MGLPRSTLSLPATASTPPPPPPPSREGPGGVFDVDKQKCPRYRGSSDCVTGSPAPYVHDIPTPPLTPDNGSEDSTVACARHDALSFLHSLFPQHALAALPHATTLPPDSRLPFALDGIVLSLPGRPKTLYVRRSLPTNVSLRDSVVALLDYVDQSLDCSALVFALDRNDPRLDTLLHALMYVGGSVVTRPPFPVHPSWVLVGMEI